MFALISSVLLYYIPILFRVTTCSPELAPPTPPSLKITSPGELEYAAVLVKRVGDNLTLDCTLHGDIGSGQRIYVWNYVAANASATGQSPYTTAPQPPSGSRLTKSGLSLSDSGHYVCSAPPHSVSKLVLVQTRGPRQCARGAFWCGPNCVLAAYVCDGFRDCPHGEDEAVQLCDTAVCARPDKLNCSNGRCIPEVACCTVNGPLCRQPACCEEHGRYSRVDGFEAEYPPLFEDRRAPDEYGFIQSTIYTVTACALIFMIAVVLLVSAICKMHMKRAALRSYAAADRETRRHYSVQYGQAHHFPPCYETSRLLEQERTTVSPAHSPTHQSATNSPVRSPVVCSVECTESAPAPDTGFGLGRLSQLLTARYHYHQTPSSPPSDEVSPPGGASPVRTRPDIPTDMYLPDIGSYGRSLNYMATPVEFYRSRALGSNLDRVMDQINRPRPLTLHLGRFQLSIPRLGRRMSTERRPDTPNVAELNIDDLDFVRLNSNDTYTLNGRTIRLLGANFENYPLLNDNNTTRPPPYTDAMRYKLYGPPPEYLSRDALNNEASNENNGNVITPVTATEQQARSNVEEPPCYEDLASGVDNNANTNVTGIVGTSSNVSGTNNVTATNIVAFSDNVTNRPIGYLADNSIGRSVGVIAGSNAVITTVPSVMAASTESNVSNDVIENISSVIDNLPAIDSDVNANETDVRYSTNNGSNETVCNNNVC